MDTAQTEKLKALALAATPGPWSAIEWTCAAPTTVRAGTVGITVADTTAHGRNSEVCAIDAAFIAEANPATVLDLIADNERLRADAERYRTLRDLMHSAKGSASIEVNQHLAYYDPAEPGQEVKLQWYPNTPIGFYTIEASTLDQVADEAIEFVADQAKAREGA